MSQINSKKSFAQRLYDRTGDIFASLELALRGYDLSSLRENETTGEIVRIG